MSWSAVPFVDAMGATITSASCPADILISPNDRATLYVALIDPNDIIFTPHCTLLKRNAGSTAWSIVARNLTSCTFAIDPSVAGDARIYGVGIYSQVTLYFRQIFRSDDGGASWTSISDGLLAPGDRVISVAVATDGTVFADGGNGIASSHDAGATWVAPAPGAPTNATMLAASPTRPGFVYAASRDGVFFGDGRTWSRLGLESFAVYGLAFTAVSDTSPPRYYVSYRGGVATAPEGSTCCTPFGAGLPDTIFTSIVSSPGNRFPLYALSEGRLSVCGDGNCSGGVLPGYVNVVEFYNSDLRHYFITASDAEANAIDAGAAGPGWSRTGKTFRVFASTAGTSASPACRFYGTRGKGPNSHFFTALPAECELVKQDQGWTLEDADAFAVFLPSQYGTESCSSGKGVYRAYNNRASSNDSNHRYVTDSADYAQMIASGWIGEGVVFCAP
jgi:hypothetical protein